MTHSLLTVAVLLAAAGCGSASPLADNAALVAAIQGGRPAEVTVAGPVAALEADSNGLHGPHERFVMTVSGVSVEIIHNLSLAPRAPVHVGEQVTVHGQLEPDPGHPIIHDTHHSTGSHEGGWIDAEGQRYE